MEIEASSAVVIVGDKPGTVCIVCDTEDGRIVVSLPRRAMFAFLGSIHRVMFDHISIAPTATEQFDAATQYDMGRRRNDPRLPIGLLRAAFGKPRRKGD